MINTSSIINEAFKQIQQLEFMYGGLSKLSLEDKAEQNTDLTKY